MESVAWAVPPPPAKQLGLPYPDVTRGKGKWLCVGNLHPVAGFDGMEDSDIWLVGGPAQQGPTMLKDWSAN